jgi:hypothetical protein
MDQREVGAPDGLTMSNIEKWLTEGKQFETTRGIILFSLFVILFVFGVLIGTSLEQHYGNTIVKDGHEFRVAGMGQLNNGKGSILIPVYEEIK